MMTIIEVTQEDIGTGIPHHCFSCPVARAVNRHTKTRVSFGARSWGSSISTAFGHIPLSAQNFIKCFDRNMEVQPFAFQLDIPDEFLKADDAENGKGKE